MKLLVAGDSFAEFVDENFFVHDAHNLYITRPGDFLVLGQLLSKEKCASKSISAPGGCISLSTMIAIHELEQNDYSHMLFYVTDFFRETYRVFKDNPSKYILDCVDVYDASFLYQTPEIISRDAADYDQISDIFDWQNGKGPDRYTNIVKHLHDCYSCLISLIQYCNANNVKLVLVFPFNNCAKTEIELRKFGITINSFDQSTILQKNITDYHLGDPRRINFTSHVYEKEHVLLFKLFNKKFPEWLG